MTDSPVAAGPIPHGVVFLYDPAAIIDVPPDTGAGPVLWTKNCVSIWVLGEYEGEVELGFASEVTDPRLDLIFYGSLETPHQMLAFNNSSCEPLVKFAVNALSVMVSVYTNGARDPTKVLCVVSPGTRSPR